MVLVAGRAGGAGARHPDGLAGPGAGSGRVSLGTPLARVSSADVASRVNAIGPVESVEVRHGWPHVLVLVVTERVPVAAAPVPGGFELVDRTGLARRTGQCRARRSARAYCHR